VDRVGDEPLLIRRDYYTHVQLQGLNSGVNPE
jgi:hypothetical protein